MPPKMHVLTEYDFPTARLEAVALVDSHTQFVDGLPYSGFSTSLVISHRSTDGLTEGRLSLALGEEDMFHLANALSAAGYKLREARLKAEKGRDVRDIKTAKA